MNAGIPIVAAERELRRKLFDALDQAGYTNIDSARDAMHAAILLEGRPGLQLVIAVFSGDEQQARISYGQLRYLSDDTDIPLMAVISEQASFDPTDLPAGFSAWLYATQMGSELIESWRRVQEKLLASATTQPVVIVTDVPGQGDYR